MQPSHVKKGKYEPEINEVEHEHWEKNWNEAHRDIYGVHRLEMPH